MDLFVDKRVGKRLYTDRDAHHYADETTIIKLIAKKNNNVVDVINNMILGSVKLSRTEKETFKIISNMLINKAADADYPQMRNVIRYAAIALAKCERSIERSIKNMSEKGILVILPGYRVKIVDSYNLARFKPKEAKFLVIELKPEETSQEISLN